MKVDKVHNIEELVRERMITITIAISRLHAMVSELGVMAIVGEISHAKPKSVSCFICRAFMQKAAIVLKF